MEGTAQEEEGITTLIFDVDDTLYDVSTGFTANRNGYGAQTFMVERLNFPDLASAKIVRDEYFAKYHSTAKALTVAQEEGRIPESAPKFDPQELSQWWAKNLDYALLGPREEYDDIRDALRTCPLQLVAFSNGPRVYVKRVLRELGLDDIFTDEKLFAVDDVLPFCKPEKEAFDIIFDKVGGLTPHQCVMIEDSMKNIRVAKDLGMKTVLVTGKGRKERVLGGKVNGQAGVTDEKHKAAEEAERTKPGDAPNVDDPSVDVSIEHCGQLQGALPGLWLNPPRFETA